MHPFWTRSQKTCPGVGAGTDQLTVPGHILRDRATLVIRAALKATLKPDRSTIATYGAWHPGLSHGMEFPVVFGEPTGMYLPAITCWDSPPCLEPTCLWVPQKLHPQNPHPGHPYLSLSPRPDRCLTGQSFVPSPDGLCCPSLGMRQVSKGSSCTSGWKMAP